MKKSAAFWFLALCASLRTAAQPAPGIPIPLFRPLTTAQGLAENSVYAIAQDRRGFLWLATQDGLSRYDGSTCRTFRTDPQRAGSLSSNYALALAADPASGAVWVGTGGGGLACYQPLTGQFTTFQRTTPDTTGLTNNFVRAVLVDRRGQVWAGTENGLHCLAPGQRRFRRVPLPGPGLRRNSIRALALAADGRLWAGTGEGVVAWLDTARQELRAAGAPLGSAVTALAADPATGALWVGTEAHGLRRWAAAGEKPGPVVAALPRAIRAVQLDAAGHVWVGTGGGGLYRLPPGLGRQWIVYRHQPGQASILPHNVVQSLFQDRSGLLWVGTEEGAACLDPRPSPFTAVPLAAVPEAVWAVTEDAAGRVWAGTETQGLIGHDPATGRRWQLRHQPQDPGSLAQDFVRALCFDGAGRLWVGTQSQGLSCLAPGATRFRHFRHQPGVPGSLGDNFVRALYYDPRGRLWVGTEGGLSRLDPATGRSTVFRHDPRDPHSLSNNFVRAMLLDRRSGQLWVGTGGGGLCRLDPTTGRGRTYWAQPRQARSLSSNFVRALWQDRAGRLWVGTEGGGLCRLDDTTGTGRFTTFREPQGLPNDVVYGLVEDRAGQLWLSTNQGLARLQPATGQLHTFDQRDGLLQDEYNAGAACRGSRTGRLYFGGVQGLVAFRPEAVHTNPAPPPVVLTGLRRFNQSVDLPDTSITERRVLRLSPRDYFFTLEFAALNFRNPVKNRYAYLLEGFDPDWVPAGTRREATYTNLDPGTYTFRVRAANNDGLWNPVGTALRIVVEPPWYRTWWFRVGLSWVVFGVLFWLYSLRIRQLLTLERVRHGIARDLHDDMGSTLSSISILSQIAEGHQRQHRPEQAAAVLAQIGESSRRMLDAMDDIVWAINPAHDSVDDVTARMRRLASEVLEAAGIEFTFRADTSLQGLKLDMRARREFFLIFKEALNNLVKYAHCQHATIRLQHQHGLLHLTVQDDGVGFDPTAPAQGSGNGLANMHARAAALHGQLNITSAPGHGTTLSLRIPVKW
ncbi:sensor histidine kinase [Hymenobacter weizhouensis]|uniref:sensor histidine kinase n=1 Tax=Hymenobacter sp. YIM 151500-1 TaxID=2987689 RepID=UPI0022278D3C|nr:sensor histidine kinase [Hymenobacter sp. YIM 151500-1]UYZ61643.1 histidine kinase [Hymenobacter sp. YIM 151500-1]